MSSSGLTRDPLLSTSQTTRLTAMLNTNGPPSLNRHEVLSPLPVARKVVSVVLGGRIGALPGARACSASGSGAVGGGGGGSGGSPVPPKSRRTMKFPLPSYTLNDRPLGAAEPRGAITVMRVPPNSVELHRDVPLPTRTIAP